MVDLANFCAKAKFCDKYKIKPTKSAKNWASLLRGELMTSSNYREEPYGQGASVSRFGVELRRGQKELQMNFKKHSIEVQMSSE